jgi:hypothetical protein
MHRLRKERVSNAVYRAVFVTSLLAAGAPMAGAQTSTTGTGNGVYLELLGNGGLYSVNYERELIPAVRMRVGFATWTAVDLFGGPGETKIRTVPITGHVLKGDGNHHVEAGAGVLVGQRSTDSRYAGPSGQFVSLIGALGYRYQRPARGFLFRVGFTPFYGFGDDVRAYPEQGFFPFLGISFGLVF